eukprot:TRINITY_DN673_c0_g1_i1.p1 TRINITY_DN673_c0_g1~~TRINITY_DN673_c0_g1_i1.p1  ORF type:complete len:333 (-),score=77.71 TRINITY_DN673_c0_g1_i1:85-1083(-)
MSQDIKRVCVTGAAGQIAYSLIFAVARGEMLGPSQQVILHLLDIPQCMDVLKGTIMELQDCAFPLLKGIVATDKPEEAFKGVDVALLVGAMPRREGMERKDLLRANAGIFKTQGKALNDHASRNVKVLVVGNPANTNCYLAISAAPDLPKENFSCLTRLDHNRAVSQIAERIGAPVTAVKNVIIWGNHSSTQYPDINHGVVVNTSTASLRTAINDDEWVRGEFVKTVQNRGAAVIKARKASSAASAAKAICDHVRDWVLGTATGEYVSMGVWSDGSYGVPKDIVYSFPVTCSHGHWSIVQSLPIDSFSRQMLDATAAELLEERDTAIAATQD